MHNQRHKLCEAISSYGANVSLLHRTYSDTKSLMEKLEEFGRRFDSSFNDVLTNFIPCEDREKLQDQLRKIPTFIIHGLSPTIKYAVINFMLGDHILPDTYSDDTKGSRGNATGGTIHQVSAWRSLYIKYGEQCSTNLVINPGEMNDGGHEFFVCNSGISNSFSDNQDLLCNLNIRLGANDDVDPALIDATLQIECGNKVLKMGANIFCTASYLSKTDDLSILKQLNDTGLPIHIYLLEKTCITDEDKGKIDQLREVAENWPILLIVRSQEFNNDFDDDNTEYEDDVLHSVDTFSASIRSISMSENRYSKPSLSQDLERIRHQLTQMGFTLMPEECCSSVADDFSAFECSNSRICITVASSTNFLLKLATFSYRVLQRNLSEITDLLNKASTKCLKMLVLSTFDMSRYMKITPKRVEYAKEQEKKLHHYLLEMTCKEEQEFEQVICETVAAWTPRLIEKASNMEISSDLLTHNNKPQSRKRLQIIIKVIERAILAELNKAISAKIVTSVSLLQDSFIGTLQRCVAHLEDDNEEELPIRNASQASRALIDILNVAYEIDMAMCNTKSAVTIVIDEIKSTIKAIGGGDLPIIDKNWKENIALEILRSLRVSRIAKQVCNQLKQRTRKSHETFITALNMLEIRHKCHISNIEERLLEVRTHYAPTLARLALTSTSLYSLCKYGMPQIGREIGRGQYGVVFGVHGSWSGHPQCCVKSVVPSDDRHFNELALEFHYTRCLPHHDRIVDFYGSVIEYSSYSDKLTVYLIIERLYRDLYCGIKKGLLLDQRLQIAADIIEGIRFLHSQGLIHRDIKLKNILLDRSNRAKISDLGFCKPEAMMSGSIVGTPVHMAPELFDGKCESSADIYAFGILFWYLCAGKITLPKAYNSCAGKSDLWKFVQNGGRPERLDSFRKECWDLMTICWSKDQNARPLAGIVAKNLDEIIHLMKAL